MISLVDGLRGIDIICPFSVAAQFQSVNPRSAEFQSGESRRGQRNELGCEGFIPVFGGRLREVVANFLLVRYAGFRLIHTDHPFY